MPSGARVCSYCGVLKPAIDFPGGNRTYWCRACYSDYAKLNRERKNQLSNAWRKRNLDRGAYHAMRRRAQKDRAQPYWADESVIKSFYLRARRLTVETGIPHEVDHFVPLRSSIVCGLHVPANLRVISKEENRKKANQFLGD